MIRLSIIGARGRLGALICAHALKDPRFTVQQLIVSSHSSQHNLTEFDGPLKFTADITEAFDVLIDVSLPAALPKTLQALASYGGALVSGVTGLDQAQQRTLQDLSPKHAILHTHNFSRGVAVLKHLAQRAAQLLGPEYQTGIIDLHHQHKIDAPSGTALSLEASLRKGGANEVQHSALRMGTIVGEHQIHFAGPAERLQLTHIADSRAMFAKGALDAAAWIATKPAGTYTMADVFGIGD